MDNDEFANLIRRAKNGDAAATSELLTRYQRNVRMMVRSKLPRTLRSKFDSMDFVQAVWKSVLINDAEALSRFNGENHFVRYLSGVAKNKVLEQYRRLTRTDKYNVALEEPLYITRGDRQIAREVAAPDPTPSQDAQAADRYEQIVKGRTDMERNVISLRREGLTYDEIAGRTGLNEAAIRRMIETFRKREENRG